MRIGSQSPIFQYPNPNNNSSGSINKPKDESVGYIGHGTLESSPASFSVLHVISHELGHVSEFKAEAARDNSDITSLDVKIDYEIRNGRLVAVSGETKVTSIKREEKNSLKPSTELQEVPDKKLENAKQVEDTRKTDKQEIRKLADGIREISTEILRLEEHSPLSDTTTEKENSGERLALEKEKKQLEMDLAEILLHKSGKEVYEILKTANEENGRMFHNLIQSGPGSKTGSILNLMV